VATTDVAAASSGATIEKYTSQYDDSTWAVTNLLAEDGDKEWAGKSAGSQEVLISLPSVTDITDISINNHSREAPHLGQGRGGRGYKGFSPVGKLSMPQIDDLHTISLPAPVAAKHVKVLFRTNHGGGYMEAARVRVYKTDVVGGRSVGQQLAETGRAVVHEIHFTTGSAEILPDSEGVLNQIVRALQQDPKLELIIEGHTDNVGGAPFNLELSQACRGRQAVAR
jgi:flagellar motor protein MotB